VKPHGEIGTSSESSPVDAPTFDGQAPAAALWIGDTIQHHKTSSAVNKDPDSQLRLGEWFNGQNKPFIIIKINVSSLMYYTCLFVWWLLSNCWSLKSAINHIMFFWLRWFGIRRQNEMVCNSLFTLRNFLPGFEIPQRQARRLRVNPKSWNN
jgi:hypothetical protein